MRSFIANMRTCGVFLISLVCTVVSVRSDAYVFPTGTTTVSGTVQNGHVIYGNVNLDETGFTVPSGATVNWAVNAGSVTLYNPITIDVGGELKIVDSTGQMKIVNTTITINGTLSIENTGNNTTTGLYSNGGTIIVNGSLNIKNSGGSEGLRLYVSTMNVADVSVFNVQDGAKITLAGGNTVTKTIGATAYPYFIANPQYADSTIITDATAYTNGFIVGNGATVVWRADAAVAGKVIVEAGGTLLIGNVDGAGSLTIGNGATLQNNGTMTIAATSGLVLGDDSGVGHLVVGDAATLQADGTITLGESSTMAVSGAVTNNATIMNRGGITINGVLTNASGARLIDTTTGQLAIGENGTLSNNGIIALGVWGGLGDDGVGPNGFASNFSGYLDGIVVPYIDQSVAIGGDGTYDLPASAFTNGFISNGDARLTINLENGAALLGQVPLILEQGAFLNDDQAERKSVVFFDIRNGKILFLPYLEGELEIGFDEDDLDPIDCDHGFGVAPGATVRINDDAMVRAGVVHVGGTLIIGDGRVMTIGRDAMLDVQPGGRVVMEGPYATLCLSDSDVYGGSAGTTIGATEGNLSGTVIFENIVWLHNLDFGGGEVNDDPTNAVVLGTQNSPINVVYRNNARVLVDGYVKIWPARQGVV